MASQPIAPSDAQIAPATPTRDTPPAEQDETRASQDAPAEPHNPASRPSSSPPPPEQVQPSPSACGVCNAAPPKYKCPRCYLPYCSVACSKIHQETHPRSASLTMTTPTPTPTPAAPATAPPASAAPANPFRALDSSEALRLLFRKYPSLPAQLLEIHAATQPPVPGRRDAWTHDVGLRNGRAALRRAKRDRGEAGEAVREYAELIAHVVGEGAAAAGQGGNGYIQQQAAREDARLIQQLMAEEQRRR